MRTLVLIVAAALSAGACEVQRAPIQQRPEKIALAASTYLRDPRTKLCFLVSVNGYQYQWVSRVPCTAEVLALVVD